MLILRRKNVSYHGVYFSKTVSYFNEKDGYLVLKIEFRNSLFEASTHRCQFFFPRDMTPPKPALYTASTGQIDRDIDAERPWKDSMGKEELRMERMSKHKKKKDRSIIAKYGTFTVDLMTTKQRNKNLNILCALVSL